VLALESSVALWGLAGKTYTMVGDLKTPEKVGIIPRAVQDLFEQLIARGGPYKVTVSFLEVYNEQLMDLLIAPEETRPLRLVEDPRRGVICQNLTEVLLIHNWDVEVVENAAVVCCQGANC
jgi:centromeric protein E